MSVPTRNHESLVETVDTSLPATWFADAAAREETAGAFGTAIQIVELGLRLHPEDVPLAFKAGTLRIRAGETAEGLERLSGLVRSGVPDNVVGEIVEAAAAWQDTAAFRHMVDALWPGGAKPALITAIMGRVLRKRGEKRDARLLLIEASAKGTGLPDWVRWETQHSSWEDDGMIEAGPMVLQNDVATFGRAIGHVLDANDAIPPADIPSHRFTVHTLSANWLRSSCRVLYAAELTPEDAAFLIGPVCLADSFLAAAARGVPAVGEACFALFPDVPHAGDRTLPLRVRDAVAAATLRAKPILCPFTGQRALVRHNVALDIFVHRAERGRCLVVSSASWTDAFQDAAWFFPEHGTLLLAGRAEPSPGTLRGLQLRIAEALAIVFNRRAEFVRYFTDAEKTIGAVQLTTAHIGHDLWNGISAWDRLFALVPPKHIDHIVFDESRVIYGSPDELYPEYAGDIRSRLVNARGQALTEFFLKHNALLVSLRDNYITEGLAQRVITANRRRCDAAFIERVASLRAVSRPLLLVTLRLGNRSWVEQEEGYIALIRRLGQDFPGLGVVLDGMNSGTDKGSTHIHMSLNDEVALAGRIEAAVRDIVTVRNSIDTPVAESIVLAEALDAFVAPIGAGMAKYRWLANKPGVAFGNKAVLDPQNYNGRLYCNPLYRETARAAVFVAPEAVVNVEAERLGLAFRANFSMDWQVLHEKLLPLLTKLLADRAFATPDLRRSG